MFGRSLLRMYRFCLHEICFWEAIAKELHPNGMNRMMDRLHQSQCWKAFLYSPKDCRKSSSLTARFAYPFILPHSPRPISYFYLPAVSFQGFFFLFAYPPTLHLHLPCSGCSTLSMNPYQHYHK